MSNQSFVFVFFFKRISIEGSLLSQATKVGSSEAMLNSRKKVPLEPSGLESEFQESIEPAYSSDQDENLQSSATEQIDADDEEESEQVGKRREKIFFFLGRMEEGLKLSAKQEGAGMYYKCLHSLSFNREDVKLAPIQRKISPPLERDFT